MTDQQQAAATAEHDDDQAGEGELSELDRWLGHYQRIEGELQEARETVQGLESERADLVLAARTGDAKAKQRISTIDKRLPGARQEVADLETALQGAADEVEKANRAEDAAERKRWLDSLRETAEARAAAIDQAEDYLRRAASQLAEAERLGDELRSATPRPMRQEHRSPLTRDRVQTRLTDFLGAIFPGLGLDRGGGIITGDRGTPNLADGERRAHDEFLAELREEIER
jgi:chromosome segregation ATPase